MTDDDDTKCVYRRVIRDGKVVRAYRCELDAGHPGKHSIVTFRLYRMDDMGYRGLVIHEEVD